MRRRPFPIYPYESRQLRYIRDGVCFGAVGRGTGGGIRVCLEMPPARMGFFWRYA